MSETQNLPAIPSDFAAALEVDGFIPSIQLIQNMSKVLVNYDAKVNGDVEPKPGMFWLGADKHLGEFDHRTKSGSFPALVCASMPHALVLDGDTPTEESFQWGSPEFERIRGMKKVNGGSVRPMWGGDTLLWVPQYNSFGIYFCHSTARSAVNAFGAHRGKFVHVEARFVKGSRFSWYVPEVLIPANELDLEKPDPLMLAAAIDKFANRTGRQPEVTPGNSERDR